MIEETHGELELLRFASWSREPGLVHAVTTKPQNYAPHRGSEREDAVRWRQQVCRILGVPFENLTAPEQVMGAEVLPIEGSDIGCGRAGRNSAVRYVDGLVTRQRQVPIVLLSADCPLICAFDPALPAIGAVHAGWQGTLAGAAANLIRQMVRQFGSEPARLLTAITPSAGPCCYEVGSDVRRLTRTRLTDADACVRERKGRLTFDLWAANRSQLIEAGVADEHIEVAGLCTICDERFWSHRRDGPEAGRFALFVALG